MNKQTTPQTKFRIHIDLLHPNELPLPLPQRFIKWLLNYGRFIVIFTEIIVIGAFVYRFQLDAKIDELKTKINKDLRFVEQLPKDESLIRQTQLKLSHIEKNINISPDWNQALTAISSIQPKKVRISSINFEAPAESSDIRFKINGQTTSNPELAVFIKNLKETKNDEDKSQFKDINLDNINYDQSLLVFSISGTILGDK